MPQNFTYGSLHALAVADMNGDGKPDIISNEQEELLPAGRENPRWIVWENPGGMKFRDLDANLGGHELQVGDVDRDGDISDGSRMSAALADCKRERVRPTLRPSPRSQSTTARRRSRFRL